METVRELLFITILAAVIMTAGAVTASHAIYKQDLRLCMAEGSKTDCEKMLK